MENKKDDKKKNIQIRVKNDDVASGNFANSFSITFSDQEFLFDFIMMQPQAQIGILTDRIIMTPKKARDLQAALTDALRAWDSMNNKNTTVQ